MPPFAAKRHSHNAARRHLSSPRAARYACARRRFCRGKLRESHRAIIGAVAAADLDALDRLIDEDITDHNAVPGQAAAGWLSSGGRTPPPLEGR